jgi:hypothetical protein
MEWYPGESQEAVFSSASGSRLARIALIGLQITVYKLALPRGRPDGATWAPMAERLVLFLVKLNDSSEYPSEIRRKRVIDLLV